MSMDDPTRKCLCCCKAKHLDASKFKRTCEGFTTACQKCLTQIAETAAHKREKDSSKESTGRPELPDMDDDDEEQDL